MALALFCFENSLDLILGVIALQLLYQTVSVKVPSELP